MEENTVVTLTRLVMCISKDKISGVCASCPYHTHEGEQCAVDLYSDAKAALESLVKKPKTLNKEEVSLEIRVSEHLKQLGVPCNLSGYDYLRKAICFIYTNQGSVHSITKELYPIIAAQVGSSSSKVERAIRHAIETGWDRIPCEVMENYFGATISCAVGKPTNSQFILTLVDYIRLEDKKT